jgi:hypothetical protein
MKKIKILPITLIAVIALVISSVAYASPAASQNFSAAEWSGSTARDNASGLPLPIERDGTA